MPSSDSISRERMCFKHLLRAPLQIRRFDFFSGLLTLSTAWPQQLQFGMRLSLWERTKETWDFLFGWNTPASRFGYMSRNRSSHFQWFYFYTPLVWAYLLGLRQS